MPLCNAPFIQMVLQPSGKISPCCYLYGKKVGDIRQQSLLEIWNGPAMQRLRAELLSNHPRTCKSRMHHIQCHLQHDQWSSQVAASTVQKGPPKKLDIRLNGTCNLKCIMCEVWQEPRAVYDQSTFWTDGPSEIFPYLQEVEVLGGEPFIQRDTFKLIDAVSKSQPHCIWAFVTNGHYPVSNRWHTTLEQIHVRRVLLSLDSFSPKTYASIRRGGNLDLPLRVLDALLSLKKHKKPTMKICLGMCVQQHNWHEVPDFYQKAQQLGVETELQYVHYDPSGTASLNHLNPQLRRTIADYFTEHLPATLAHPLTSPLLRGLDF